MAFYFSGIKDYYQIFFKNLYELRQDATFCDVKLQVSEEIFLAHRIVLMSGSAYFHAMFATEMSEHHKDEVMIGGVTPSIFKALLDFIYSGIFFSKRTSQCLNWCHLHISVLFEFITVLS